MGVSGRLSWFAELSGGGLLTRLFARWSIHRLVLQALSLCPGLWGVQAWPGRGRQDVVYPHLPPNNSPPPFSLSTRTARRLPHSCYHSWGDNYSDPIYWSFHLHWSNIYSEQKKRSSCRCMSTWQVQAGLTECSQTHYENPKSWSHVL